MTVNIEIISGDAASIQASLDRLRAKLSPDGNIVSDAGRQRTIDVFGEPLTPVQVVERICTDVRTKGIDSLLEYNRKLDKADLSAGELRVPTEELEKAHAKAAPELLDSVRRIRENILEFQTAILHSDQEVKRTNGVSLTQRYTPMRRVGVCVPGGAAAYPSTVLMTAVPAQAAGVEELAIVAPPTKFGSYNADILATCHELGITEVFRMGGAQAVAALAFGVEGIEPVDKIVGPGNLFVALAKKFVYGHVDIDSIAGPSEVVVIADETTSPEFTAADLLAQAEHAPGSSVLITWHEPTLQATLEALNKQLAGLSRSELTRPSLEDFSAAILVPDADEAVRITNLLAPEHLHIACKNPRELNQQITTAGATFLGPYSPVAVGDYAAGPSHVLPTGGTARWASGLCSNSFLRSSSVIEFDQKSLSDIAPDVREIALREGLTAHWESVRIRNES